MGTTAAQLADPQGVLGNQEATLLMTDGSMALTFFPTFVVDFDGKLVGLNIPVPMDPILMMFSGNLSLAQKKPQLLNVWKSYLIRIWNDYC